MQSKPALHAHLGKQALPEKQGKRISARVAVSAFQNLACPVLKKVVQPVGSAVTVQGFAVIPNEIKSQHLDHDTWQSFITCMMVSARSNKIPALLLSVTKALDFADKG